MTELPANPQEAIEISSQHDAVTLKRLTVNDAQFYFDLIDYDRSHLSRAHADGKPDLTAQNYPDVQTVIDSIENPVPNKYRFGTWDGNTMVGTNNLRIIAEGVGESGSWIGAQYVGHNYAARGRALLLEFAFTNLGLEKVESHVAIGNEASRKSVERSGYRLVEERDGEWIYIITRDDWLSAKDKKPSISDISSKGLA